MNYLEKIKGKFSILKNKTFCSNTIFTSVKSMHIPGPITYCDFR